MEMTEKTLRRTRPRLSKRRKIFLIAGIIVILVFSIYTLLEFNLGPVLSSYAQSMLSSMASKSMQEAIVSNLDESFSYSDLIQVLQNSDGRVTMLQANTQNMNRLAAKITLTAQENIAAIGERGISIPLGTIIGGKIFTGWGPNITVKVTPIGSVTSEFLSEFESAGINQTMHRVKIRLNSTMRVLLPTGGTTVTVTAEAPIAESIIIGDVPGVYANIGGNNDALKLIPDS